MLAQNLWRQRLEAPAYRVGQVASYARVSPQTITQWERPSNSKRPMLNQREKKAGISFLQLIEIAVVSAMRKQGVKVLEIRAAREFLATKLGVKYPFAQIRFKADGVDILLEFDELNADGVTEKLVVANKGGQMIWTDMLSDKLREFNYDLDGIVDSWKVNGIESRIEISPKVSFGMPHIRGVSTLAVKQRWAGGYSVPDISDDLGLKEDAVEEALRFEGLVVDRERRSFWIN